MDAPQLSLTAKLTEQNFA